MRQHSHHLFTHNSESLNREAYPVQRRSACL